MTFRIGFFKDNQKVYQSKPFSYRELMREYDGILAEIVERYPELNDPCYEKVMIIG